jgi:hypothetical protein
VLCVRACCACKHNRRRSFSTVGRPLTRGGEYGNRHCGSHLFRPEQCGRFTTIWRTTLTILHPRRSQSDTSPRSTTRLQSTHDPADGLRVLIAHALASARPSHARTRTTSAHTIVDLKNKRFLSSTQPSPRHFALDVMLRACGRDCRWRRYSCTYGILNEKQVGDGSPSVQFLCFCCFCLEVLPFVCMYICFNDHSTMPHRSQHYQPNPRLFSDQSSLVPCAILQIKLVSCRVPSFDASDYERARFGMRRHASSSLLSC